MAKEDFRVTKTKAAIHEAFLACLEEVGFLGMSVTNIIEKALINRSTFYKHYQDKYDLRDRYVDSVIAHFVTNLDTDFVAFSEITDDSYFEKLRRNLSAFQVKKREYLILWNHNLQERNVYEEMVFAGAKKLEKVFENDPTISEKKKPLFSFYAISFISRMMVSIRWWFMEGDWIGIDAFTHLMIHGKKPPCNTQEQGLKKIAASLSLQLFFL